MRPPGTLYLVRHGEVENPDHLVYADLQGFGLSQRGKSQAAAIGDHLRTTGITTIFTSPLERAQETARVISGATGATVITDAGLTEWRIADRWAGRHWESLDDEFPGELEAYLDHPHDLSFAPESLVEVAARMEAALRGAPAVGTSTAVVSHQDPIQALRRSVTGHGFRDFHIGKPGHGGVVTLVADPWTEVGYWEPDQGLAFPPAPSTEKGPVG